MGASDSDDEPLALSSHALAALAEFRSEQDAHDKHFERIKADAEELLTMAAFAEDWNKSQFWYSDETADLLAGELLEGADGDETIAVISVPSVFVAMKRILNSYDPSKPKPEVVLLEHDKRFASFREFVFYDYRQPLQLPAELKSSAKRLIVDPPYLNEDCQTKAALTARWLAKPNADRVIVSTGERMKPVVVDKVYKHFGVQTTTYQPVHSSELGNEFGCYANFECAQWKWEGGEDDKKV